MDLKTINHVAHLAKLELTENEKNQFAEQLSKVIQHFQEIATIDTTGIEPLVTPTNNQVFLRADEPRKIETTEELLKNAPERTGQLFKVPPVV